MFGLWYLDAEQTEGPYVTWAILEESTCDFEVKWFCKRASTVTYFWSTSGVDFFCCCDDADEGGTKDVLPEGPSSCNGLFSPTNEKETVKVGQDKIRRL